MIYWHTEGRGDALLVYRDCPNTAAIENRGMHRRKNTVALKAAACKGSVPEWLLSSGVGHGVVCVLAPRMSISAYRHCDEFIAAAESGFVD